MKEIVKLRFKFAAWLLFLILLLAITYKWIIPWEDELTTQYDAVWRGHHDTITKSKSNMVYVPSIDAWYRKGIEMLYIENGGTIVDDRTKHPK